MEKNHIKFHIFFFLIFSINYIFSFLIFGDFTSFYHDNFDSVIVYNKIIGDVYSNKISDTDIFLGGQIKYYYLRHFFKPFILLYALFDAKIAYYLTEIIVKLISYFSFFLLTKKLSKNFFVNALCSALFASALPFSTMGFGLACMPYIIYLLAFKKKLNFKHFLSIIFFGLNTDLIAELFFIPICFLILSIINFDFTKKNLKNIFLIFSLFFLTSLLTSSNLLYSALTENEMHRLSFNKKEIFFFERIKHEFFSLLKLPNGLNWTFVKNLPLTLLLLPSFILAFITKNQTAVKIFYLIIFIHILHIIFDSNIFKSAINFLPLFNAYRFSWILIYLNILYVLLILFLLINKKNKFLLSLSFLSLLLFQINAAIVPFVKKNIFKEKNYRNIYTFKDYYLYDDYKQIKNIVKQERALSLGLDPMIAVMNEIKSIDGYHGLYPLDYKKKFYEIIKEEIKKDSIINDYYLNWGSRVYAFVVDPKNIEIDFLKAKELGASYVISKYKLSSKDLIIVNFKSNHSIYLYKIN